MPHPALEHTLLHTLADNVPHRIYAKDAAGRFIFANRAVAQGMGVAGPEDLLGKTDFDFYPQQEAARYFEEEQEIIRTGRPMINHEEHVQYLLLSQDVWLLTTKVPLHDESGRAIGIIGINYDISSIKAAEQVLREAKRQAEEAARAKSALLAAMSHELRTPLNSVLGYVQVLRHDDNLSTQQVAKLDTIERSSKHLLLLVNDVLDAAKIESGHFELALAPVQLCEFLQIIGDIISVKATEKQLRFTLALDPALPLQVEADERRLGQVLLNLLGNAVKFTAAGSVTLKASTAADGRIRFAVEDTGVGLQVDDLQKIFQPFQQAGPAQQRAEGTGLGLTIARELVEAMGGHIGVSSEPGRGSVFSFELALPVLCSGNVDHADDDALCTATMSLPADELAALQTLARAGNMKSIGQYAERLASKGDQYRGIAAHLRLLAGRYETRAIVDLVNRLGAEATAGA